MSEDKRTGVLILGHGSRYPEGLQVITKTAARYQDAHPELVIGHGFVEMAHPQLEESVQSLAEAGMATIIVVPLFLSFGHHIAEDLPDRMAKLEAVFPAVKFITTAPIGADPLLCEIVQARIEESAPDTVQ